MNPLDFIATARAMLEMSTPGRPRQSDLRRAVSTAYYALFHCLALRCADLLVGGPGANRSQSAWNQTYRALQHGFARQRCQHPNISDFPATIRYFADVFVDTQRQRHLADYDPDWTFAKAKVIQLIDLAEDAILGFLQVPARDRRAFTVYVLLPTRNN